MRQNFYKTYAPNPRMERSDYDFLCGIWQFSFDDAVFDRTIKVPFTCESEASGIGDTSCHECVWYRRKFRVHRHSGRLLLHFEGVDYHSFIYLNGKSVGEHIGGFTSFCLDITDAATEGENEIVLKVLDSFDKSQLRGKQRAKCENYDCWYVQSTGIWKPVWLEYVGSTYVENISFRTENDGSVEATVRLSGDDDVSLTVFDGDSALLTVSSVRAAAEHILNFKVDCPKLWNSEHPNLYYVKIQTKDDEVKSYFGFRTVEVKENGLYINGVREYQQMILYQGYWQKSLLTAPDDAALEADVKLIKEMGFNGVRVHQKIENEVFYYICDKFGLYVWGEIPSAYEFTERMKEEYKRDFKLIFEQLKDYVCIISWLLFNETWGVYQIKEDKSQQEYIEDMTKFIRARDKRPVITNDGWYHLDSDILSLHEYEQDSDVFAREYRDKEYVVKDKIINTNKFGKAFADGYSYNHQPVFISEYGGIAIKGKEGWGYGKSADDITLYEERLRKLVNAIRSLPYVSGCCYTQFNDVQQEINGLLDSDRKEKLPVGTISSIFATK